MYRVVVVGVLSQEKHKSIKGVRSFPFLSFGSDILTSSGPVMTHGAGGMSGQYIDPPRHTSQADHRFGLGMGVWLGSQGSCRQELAPEWDACSCRQLVRVD